jgi:hypothetical protein
MVQVTDAPSLQSRLYDAATAWSARRRRAKTEALIAAAASCLAAGIESPALRRLAAAVPDAPSELAELVEDALAELGLPAPGRLPGFLVIGDGGEIHPRPARDRVRFEIRPEPTAGHEVLIYVNDVEITERGAGLGIAPFDLLVPVNRLVPSPAARRVAIARCGCGEVGCCATRVVIRRRGDAVHWDWTSTPPLPAGVAFDAAQYDAEVARVGADRSWETPADTTARIVLTDTDRVRLATYGLRLAWASKDYADADVFKVALDLRSEPGLVNHQVFLRVPVRGRSPETVAYEVVATLAEEPRTWSATWHPTSRRTSGRPEIAGPNWRQERLG